MSERPPRAPFAERLALVRGADLAALHDGAPTLLFPAGGKSLGELLAVAALGSDGLPEPRKGIHGLTHYRMVAVLAVKLALSEGWESETESGLRDLWCLWVAGCLHDLKRWDDALDWGHASRGAKLAAVWLPAQGVDEGRTLTVAELIRGHGRSDERELTPLQRLFKDADGLDRFRLGLWQCDRAQLRTESARALWPELRALYRSRR